MAAGDLYVKLCGVLLILVPNFVSPDERTTMKLTGKINVSGLSEGISLGEESFLSVKLEDTSMMDASAVLLGEDNQSLPVGTKLGPGSEGLNYTIVFKKPENLGPQYSVSAVLNVGWKPSGDKWIKKGDYLTDTVHDVDLRQETDPIVADVVMVLYA